MCLAQGPQRSDAGEARTGGPWVSSQALLPLSHCAPSIEVLFTGLPMCQAEGLLHVCSTVTSRVDWQYVGLPEQFTSSAVLGPRK